MSCLAPTLTYAISPLAAGHLASFGLPHGEGPGRQASGGV